jgi:hypothetical protein
MGAAPASLRSGRDPTTAVRTLVQRREGADGAPADDAALTSGGSDHSLDLDGILDGLVESPPSLLLHLGHHLDVGEALAALEALPARRAAYFGGVVLGRFKREPTDRARSSHRHWRDMVGAETFAPSGG